MSINNEIDYVITSPSPHLQHTLSTFNNTVTFHHIFKTYTIRLNIFHQISLIHQHLQAAYKAGETKRLHYGTSSPPRPKVSDVLEVKKGREFNQFISIYQSLRFGRTDLFYKYYPSTILENDEAVQGEEADEEERVITISSSTPTSNNNNNNNRYDKKKNKDNEMIIVTKPIKLFPFVERSMVFFTVAMYTNNIPILTYLIDRLGLNANHYCSFCAKQHVHGLAGCEDKTCHNHQMIRYFKSQNAIYVEPGAHVMHLDTVKFLLFKHNLTAILALTPLVNQIYLKIITDCNLQLLQSINPKIKMVSSDDDDDSSSSSSSSSSSTSSSESITLSMKSSSSESSNGKYYTANNNRINTTLSAFHLFLEKKPASEILAIIEYWVDHKVGKIEWTSIIRFVCSQVDSNGNDYIGIFNYIHNHMDDIKKYQSMNIFPSNLMTCSTEITKALFNHYPNQLKLTSSYNIYYGAVVNGNSECIKYIYNNYNHYEIRPLLLTNALERGQVQVARTLIEDVWPLENLPTTPPTDVAQIDLSNSSDSSMSELTVSSDEPDILPTTSVPLVKKWIVSNIKSTVIDLQFINYLLEREDRVTCSFERVYGKAIKANKMDVVARINEIVRGSIHPWCHTFKIDYSHALLKAVKAQNFEMIEYIIKQHHPTFVINKYNNHVFIDSKIGLEMLHLIAATSTYGDLLFKLSKSSFWYHPEVTKLILKFNHYIDDTLPSGGNPPPSLPRRLSTGSTSSGSSSQSYSESESDSSYDSDSDDDRDDDNINTKIVKKSKLFQAAVRAGDIDHAKILHDNAFLKSRSKYFPSNVIIGMACMSGNLELLKYVIGLGYPIRGQQSLISICLDCPDREKAIDIIYYMIDQSLYRLAILDIKSAISLFTDKLETTTIITPTSTSTIPTRGNFKVFIRYAIDKFDKMDIDDCVTTQQVKLNPIKNWFTARDQVSILLNLAFTKKQPHILQAIYQLSIEFSNEKKEYLDEKERMNNVELATKQPSLLKKKKLSIKLKPSKRPLECPRLNLLHSYVQYGEEILIVLDIFYYKYHLNHQKQIIDDKQSNNNDIDINNNNNNKNNKRNKKKNEIEVDVEVDHGLVDPVNYMNAIIPSSYRQLVKMSYSYGWVNVIRQRHMYKAEHPDTIFDIKYISHLVYSSRKQKKSSPSTPDDYLSSRSPSSTKKKNHKCILQ